MCSSRAGRPNPKALSLSLSLLSLFWPNSVCPVADIMQFCEGNTPLNKGWTWITPYFSPGEKYFWKNTLRTSISTFWCIFSTRYLTENTFKSNFPNPAFHPRKWGFFVVSQRSLGYGRNFDSAGAFLSVLGKTRLALLTTQHITIIQDEDKLLSCFPSFAADATLAS